MRELVRIGPQQVVERMGVLPEQVPDFKALAGDASDNIPGARGIGPKAAAALLLKYGTLEAILDARTDTPPSLADQLRMFKRIVCMRRRTERELPRPPPPNWQAAAGRLGGARRPEQRRPHRRSGLSSEPPHRIARV